MAIILGSITSVPYLTTASTLLALDASKNIANSDPTAFYDINITGSAGTASPTGPAGGALTGSYPNPGIANLAVTNAMLFGGITASKLVGTDIDIVGTITTGTWHGAPISPAYFDYNTTNFRITGGQLNTIQDIDSLAIPSFLGLNLSGLTAGELIYADGSNNLSSGNLSGDITTSGGLVTILATVNSNIGSFGDASHSLTLTANGKGLLTAISSNSIQISESQVTNLITDLSEKLDLSGGTMTGNLILNADATNALQAVTFQQLNAAVVGVYKLQGGYDPTATSLYPVAADTTNPVSAIILQGMIWSVTVNGIVNGNAVTVGDQLLALIDSPGQTDANWSIINNITNFLPSSNIFVGNASNIAAAVVMSGDASISNTGALTLSNHAVTYGKFQQVAASSIVGNPTGSLADAQGITLGTSLTFSGSTINTIQGITTASSPTFLGLTVNTIVSAAATILALSSPLPAANVDAVGITIIASNGNGSGSSAGGPITITSGSGHGSSGANGGDLSITTGNGSSGNDAGTLTLKSGTSSVTGGITNLIGGAGSTSGSSGGQVNVTGGAAPGFGTGGNAVITGGSASTSGTGGDVILTGGASGTTGSIAGNVRIRGGIASSGTQGAVVFDQGSVNFNLLSASSLLGTDVSKNAITGSLSGDITTSGFAATLATVNSNVGTFGDATHAGQFTVNGKGLITSASSVLITGTVPGGSAGGDLSGTYPNPTVAKINGVSLGTTTATAGNILIGSGSAWVTNAMGGDITMNLLGTTAIGSNKVTFAKFQQVGANNLVGNATGSLANATGISLGSTLTFVSTALQTTAMTGDVTASANSFSTTVAAINGVSLGSTTATAGNILIGSGTQWVTNAMSGDITIGSTGVTAIGANKVTLAQMAQIITASFLGRNTASTGNVEVLSTSTAKTMLNLSGTNSGDVTLSGENYISLSGQALTAAAVNLSGTNATGILAAARFPALTGDVTTSSGAVATTIAANAVNYSKFQQVAASSLVGNATGSLANAAGITLGTSLTFSGSTINAIQGIRTADSPTFTGLSLSGGTMSMSGVVANSLTISSATGASNSADLILNRFDLANGFNRVLYKTGGSAKWGVGSRSTSENFLIYDEANSKALLTFIPGASGALSPVMIAANAQNAVTTWSFSNDNNTSSANSKFEVRIGGSSAGDAFLTFDVTGVGGWSVGLDNSDSDTLKFDYGAPASPGSGTKLVIDTTGNLYPGTDNSFTLGKSGNRWSQLWAGTTTINTSDASTKNSINKTRLGLDFINKLKPREFKFNEGKRVHHGLVAQEVKKILDDLNIDSDDFAGYIDPRVENKNDKSPCGLRYSEFIAPIILAIQELSEKISKMKLS